MSRPVYYLDTCIFILYLEKEKKNKKLFDAVSHIFTDFLNNNCILITSTLTVVEILPYNTRPETDKILMDFFKRSNFLLIDVHIKIAETARDLRKHFNKPKKYKLDTPDSIHLASAKVYNADKFFTIDGLKNNDSLTKLLTLSNKEVLNNMDIVAPSFDHLNVKQMDLDI